MAEAITMPVASALRMPGATLVTRLKVYDTVSPDGQRGGTPHFHFLCTEMYYVLVGSGSVEMIDHDGFSRVDLFPNSALIFSPGTLHRLINPHGDMELLVIMQNSGLPERGDNVVCFTDEWLAHDARFAEAMTVKTPEDAYRRRDRGVEGFIRLKAAFERGRDEGLRDLHHLYDLASQRIQPRTVEWKNIVEQSAGAQVKHSYDHINALSSGSSDYLLGAQHHLIHAGSYSNLGFCGHLNRYFDPATLNLEGLVKDNPPRP